MKIHDPKFSLAQVQNESEVKSFCIKLTLILFISFGFNFSLFTFNPPRANAQSLSLSISPPILEVMIKPGKSITQVYKITNNGEPVIVTLRLGELENRGFKADTPLTPEPWISLINSEIGFDRPFLLPEGAGKEILLRINPPLGTSEQDYYRSLEITTRTNPPADTTSSLVSQQINSPLLITVSTTGLVKKEAQISKFNVSTFIDSFGPLIGDFEIKNIGKTYFRPVGNIILKSFLGKASYAIIPQAVFIGESKQLLAERFSIQMNKPKSISLPGFFIGRYELALDFNLDQGTTQLNQKKVFYAFPFKASFVIIVLGLLVYFVFLRKILPRKDQSQNQKSDL